MIAKIIIGIPGLVRDAVKVVGFLILAGIVMGMVFIVDRFLC